MRKDSSTGGTCLNELYLVAIELFLLELLECPLQLVGVDKHLPRFSNDFLQSISKYATEHVICRDYNRRRARQVEHNKRLVAVGRRRGNIHLRRRMGELS